MKVFCSLGLVLRETQIIVLLESRDRRRILHFNVTRHPTSTWVVQQLREAFPYDSAPEYLIFDRGSNFNEEVVDTIKSFGIAAPGSRPNGPECIFPLRRCFQV